MTETQQRFLKAVAERVPLDRVAEVYLFPAIRQGGVETGIAVVAAEVPAESPPEVAAEVAAEAVATVAGPSIPPPAAVAPDQGPAAGAPSGGAVAGAGAASDTPVEIRVEADADAAEWPEVAGGGMRVGELADAAAQGPGVGRARLARSAEASRATPVYAAADAWQPSQVAHPTPAAPTPAIPADAGAPPQQHDRAGVESGQDQNHADRVSPTPVRAASGPDEQAENGAAGGESSAETGRSEPSAESRRDRPTERATQPVRHTIYSARYRLTLKGPDRGKWEVDVVAEADAPLVTLDAIVRGIRKRTGEAADAERVSPDVLRNLAAPPT